MMRHTWTSSPLGDLLLVGDDLGLRQIVLPTSKRKAALEPTWIHDPAFFTGAIGQLQAYFEGSLREFDLELALEGTPFQKRVWEALRTIPYGATLSYGELAQRIGRPGAARAVGAANGSNPLPIVIPCHRVIGADGALVGYGGGMEVKTTLLRLEQAPVPV